MLLVQLSSFFCSVMHKARSYITTLVAVIDRFDSAAMVGDCMHAVSSQFSPTGWIAIIIPAPMTRAAASSIDHDGSSLLEFVAPEVGRCIIAALIFIPVLDYYSKIAAPDLNKRLNRSTGIRCLASFIRFSIWSRVAIKIY
jgi:hypothetical protein